MKQYYELSNTGKVYQIEYHDRNWYPWVVWGYNDNADVYCEYIDCFRTLHEAREYVRTL